MSVSERGVRGNAFGPNNATPHPGLASLARPSPPRGEGNGGAGFARFSSAFGLLPSAFSSFPFCVLCALCVLCVEKNLCQAADAQDDPEVERASFKVHEGYEVNLFASEKEGIVKPIQLRWDAQGRLFVACSPSYPQLEPGQKPDDMIVMLEDPQRTGRATKSTVFARGLNTPMGLEIGDGGIYAGTGGELIHLKDTNGDGVADERKTILRGFFTADSHQNINSFVWSPSGELYFCQGLHASSRVETVFGVERLEKAGVWRYTPRTGKLDPFLGWDTGPQNPFGIVFDDYGQPLMVAGNGQGVYYLKPALIRTDNRIDPKQIWTKSNKLGGADIIGTQHFPPETQGRMVSGCYLNNALYWFEISDDGAGFRVKDLPPLIVSTSTNFRAVDVRFGPDGALYVADWFNPIIGHYQASFRHPQRDKAHGRIWRITAKGRPLITPPELTKMGSYELAAQLASPERWVRYQAIRLLREMREKGVVAATKFSDDYQLDHNTSGEQRFRVEMDCHDLIAATGIVPKLPNEEEFRNVLRPLDSRVVSRCIAVESRVYHYDPVLLPLLIDCARDQRSRVRLEAVVAASWVASKDSIRVVAAAAEQPTDSFLKYAMTQAAHALKPYWKPALESGELAGIISAQGLEFILKADGSKDALKPVLKLLESEKLDTTQRNSLLQVVIRVGGPSELGRVLAEINPLKDESAILYDEFINVWRDRKVKPDGDLAKLLDVNPFAPEPVRIRIAQLAGVWRLEALRPLLVGRAGDRRHSVALRTAGFQGLADLGGDISREFFREHSKNDKPDLDRSLAISAWSRLDLPDAAKAAAEFLNGRETAFDPAALLSAFLDRQEGSEILAKALANSKIHADSAKLALRAISAAGRQDPELLAIFNRAAGITNEELEYSADYVKKLAEEVAKSGDAHRGENVFRGTITNCLSCHGIGGVGSTVGPDLGEIGTGMPLDMLIEAVLWPNRQVKEGYMSTLVVTKDGRRVQGLRLSDDKQEIVLRDPGNDTRIRIPTSDVKAKKDIGSIMPSSLTSGLTREETRDMIRFLSELGKPGEFRVSIKPLVRSWSMLTQIPAANDNAAAELADGLKQDSSAWTPIASTVSGHVPLRELKMHNGVGWLSFRVEVLKAGIFVFPGVYQKLYADNKPVEQALELKEGTHTILVRISQKELKYDAVYCRVEPREGSTGEIRILNR